MKYTKLLLTVFILLNSMFMYSQTSVNLQYGPNIASVKTNDFSNVLNDSRRPIVGHFVQASLEHRIANNFDASIGIGYREKGFQIEEIRKVSLFNIAIPLGGRIESHIKSVEVPIQAKYNIPLNGVNTYILMGGGFSFNIDSKFRPYASILGDIALPEIGLNNTINKNEIYGTIGAGISYPMGMGKVFGEVTYNQSFKNYTSDLFIDVPLKNRSFTVGIGYSMPIN